MLALSLKMKSDNHKEQVLLNSHNTLMVQLTTKIVQSLQLYIRDAFG